MRFFVLLIFNGVGVIMDGHLIFCVVDAGINFILILIRIVLLLHFQFVDLFVKLCSTKKDKQSKEEKNRKGKESKAKSVILQYFLNFLTILSLQKNNTN